MSKKDTSRKLAAFIQMKRKTLGMTQEELSEAMNLDYKHTQRLESRKYVNDPRLSTLIALSKALKSKVSDLFNYLLK